MGQQKSIRNEFFLDHDDLAKAHHHELHCCSSKKANGMEKLAHEHKHDHGHHHEHAHHHDHQHTQRMLKESISEPQKTARGMKTYFRIMQMDCPTEEALLRKKLLSLSVVFDLEFNLIERVLCVEHKLGAEEKIMKAISDLGMTPETAEQVNSGKSIQKKSFLSLPQKMGISLFLAIASECAHWMGFATFISAGLAVLAILLSGLDTYKKGWIALRHLNLNINALMSVAVTGAFLLKQWPEAAMVMVLFSFAEWIEAKSLDRARLAIKNLMKIAPDQVWVQQSDGQWQKQKIQSVQLGQVVRVKPGERIGLDGVVIEGISTVDQALMTGESVPVEKVPGETVFAGTMNQQGTLNYQVTALANQTALARIIHSIEEAQSKKAPTQRFVDRFSEIYTPIVFIFALGVAFFPALFDHQWQTWIYRALVILVIACPCALVISTPVTIVSALALAARKGIFIKGGLYLEQGRHLTCLALDKTGTLTQGQLKLAQFLLWNPEVSEENVKRYARSLAMMSNHPVSASIAQAFQAQALLSVESFQEMVGKGIKGDIESKTYWLGNYRLAKQLNLSSKALGNQLRELEQSGQTVVMLMNEASVLALFAVADQVKEIAQQAIQQLHQRDVKTVMLTGDNVSSAQSIAKKVGVQQVFAELLPEDKLAKIQWLDQQQNIVGMVGDGINDAPALAQSHIGFAMGAMGSDIALETADVALMDDDLRKIPVFIDLSKKTHRILLQNISFALSIKLLFLVLTLMGLGTMWMAVFADAGASLLVVANGLRLLKNKNAPLSFSHQ